MRGSSLLVLCTSLALPVAALASEDAYALLKDQNEATAANVVRSETSGSTLLATDLSPGTGRVAQSTRRWTVRFEVLVPGREPQTGEIQILVPRLSIRLDQRVIRPGDFHEGAVPSSVLLALAGMRVGGVRQISVPASLGGSFPKPLPLTSGRPSSADNLWRASFGASTEFIDGRTGKTVLTLPIDKDAIVKAQLVEICRPHFEIVTSHTIIDVNTYRTLRIGRCD